MTVVDPNRLRRALYLTVTPRGVNAWEVCGGSLPHCVTESCGRLDCDCADHRIRGTRCKHVLAVSLSHVPPAILAGLRQLVRDAAERHERMDAWADGQRPLGWEGVGITV